MSILAAVSQNNTHAGIRAVISGVEKIGKTTLACNAPRALLVPLEAGFSGVKVNRTPVLDNFDAIMQVLDEAIYYCSVQQFHFQTIVFDSATALERILHQKVLATDPLFANGNKKGLIMDNALGGYGKAYNFANDLFGNFLAKCDSLAITYGINIILTCHVFAAEVVDPTAGKYNCWDLLLHSPKNQKNYGKREMVTQWADLIGFIHEPIFVTEGKEMNKAISQNKGRILAVNRTPSYVAGNRFKMVNDIVLPADSGWNWLAQEIYNTSGIDYFNRDV